MWWKIYFWIQVVFSIIVFIGLTQYTPLVFADILGLILYSLLLLATYSYVFKKRTLPSNIWNIVFIIFVVTAFMDLTYALVFPPLYDTIFPFLKTKVEATSTDYVIGVLLALPGFYATYHISNLSHGKKQKK